MNNSNYPFLNNRPGVPLHRGPLNPWSAQGMPHPQAQGVTSHGPPGAAYVQVQAAPGYFPSPSTIDRAIQVTASTFDASSHHVPYRQPNFVHVGESTTSSKRSLDEQGGASAKRSRTDRPAPEPSAEHARMLPELRNEVVRLHEAVGAYWTAHEACVFHDTYAASLAFLSALPTGDSSAFRSAMRADALDHLDRVRSGQGPTFEEGTVCVAVRQYIADRNLLATSPHLEPLLMGAARKFEAMSRAAAASPGNPIAGVQKQQSLDALKDIFAQLAEDGTLGAQDASTYIESHTAAFHPAPPRRETVDDRVATPRTPGGPARRWPALVQLRLDEADSRWLDLMSALEGGDVANFCRNASALPYRVVTRVLVAANPSPAACEELAAAIFAGLLLRPTLYSKAHKNEMLGLIRPYLPGQPPVALEFIRADLDRAWASLDAADPLKGIGTVMGRAPPNPVDEASTDVSSDPEDEPRDEPWRQEVQQFKHLVRLAPASSDGLSKIQAAWDRFSARSDELGLPDDELLALNSFASAAMQDREIRMRASRNPRK